MRRVVLSTQVLSRPADVYMCGHSVIGDMVWRAGLCESATAFHSMPFVR